MCNGISIDRFYSIDNSIFIGNILKHGKIYLTIENAVLSL